MNHNNYLSVITKQIKNINLVVTDLGKYGAAIAYDMWETALIDNVTAEISIADVHLEAYKTDDFTNYLDMNASLVGEIRGGTISNCKVNLDLSKVADDVNAIGAIAVWGHAGVVKDCTVVTTHEVPVVVEKMEAFTSENVTITTTPQE